MCSESIHTHPATSHCACFPPPPGCWHFGRAALGLHTHTPKQSLITEAAQCPLVRIDNPDHNVLLQYAVLKLPFFGFSISGLSFSLSLRLCPSLLGSVSLSQGLCFTLSLLVSVHYHSLCFCRPKKSLAYEDSPGEFIASAINSAVYSVSSLCFYYPNVVRLGTGCKAGCNAISPSAKGLGMVF